MKKVLGQTVRDLKREVNKKVSKVPGIEQKILDATSNEPWGPHGSHLSELAQATLNYHGYQIIMTVIWKRISATGKNWRHVYKALTVLEYLAIRGSEYVLDEIQKHAYQISSLGDFQYIDSSGRDQGSNVRRKSQSLIALVNDRDRIQEVREKAFVKKERSRRSFSTGAVYKLASHPGPGDYGNRYDDHFEGRYGSRGADLNGYERESDRGYWDVERSGRTRRSADGRESYRDEEYRRRDNDDFQFGSKNRRSTDRDTRQSFDGNDRYSSRQLEHKLSGHDVGAPPIYSGHDVGAPPIYEEAVRDSQSHIHHERNEGDVATQIEKESSPPPPKVDSLLDSMSTSTNQAIADVSETSTKGVSVFDDFDPHGSVSDAPPSTGSPEMNFLGSLSASDSIDSLLLVPVASAPTSVADPLSSGIGMNYGSPSVVSPVSNQPFEDPFGYNPFITIPDDDFTVHQQNFAPESSLQPSSEAILQLNAQEKEAIPGFDFGVPISGLSSLLNSEQFPPNPACFPPELSGAQASNDPLGYMFPQTEPSALVSSHGAQPVAQTNLQASQLNLMQTNVQAAHSNLPPQSGFSTHTPQADPTPVQPAQPALPTIDIQTVPFSLHPQLNLVAPTPLVATTPTPGPLTSTQPSKNKFEPKSAVWADTLSRGLVDLNISGSKANPLADIGIDFDSINRKEKRKEAKSSTTPVTSTISMGKAMGAGSGIGRASASGLVPPPNPMMGSGMNVGMAGNVYHPMAMGLGMNMGMGQGAPMWPPSGMTPPGSGNAGMSYNPMMGMGGYRSQQPYGGAGYR